MNILTVPPDFTLPAPVARRLGQRIDLANPSATSSLERAVHLGYPSPPMSDSPSPTRRLEQQYGGVNHLDRRSIYALNGLQPPSTAPVSEPIQDAQRSYIPQYSRDQQLQQHYPPPQLPPPHHPYQATQPPSGPFTFHHPPGPAMQAPAFYPTPPVVSSYPSGYHVDLPSGPSYGGHSAPVPQGPPVGDHALRTVKTARRTKAHVASACVNCKKAHLSCDAKRPCTRCVASNKQASCYDVPHKKRGRPRLREDRAAAAEEPIEVGRQGAVTPSGPVAQAWPIARHRRTNSLRVLRSQRPDERPMDAYPSPLNSQSAIDPMLPNRASMPASTDMYRETRPVAFLNIDLVILKSNSAFQELLAFHGDLRGRSVSDLMEPGQGEVVQRLRNELRDEREVREPAYMPPINPRGEQEALDAISVHFIDSLTHSYQDRHFTWTFRLRNGQSQALRVNVRLAKTTIFFVALIIEPYQIPSASPAIPSLRNPAVGTPATLGMSGASPRSTQARELPYYDPTRPSQSGVSSPPSPFSFQSPVPSLPQGLQTGLYSTSPTSRPDTGYVTSYPTPQAAPAVPHQVSYPSSSSRPPSATSEPSNHRTPRRPESLQLPPLRAQQAPPALVSPQFSDPGTTTLDRVRRREASFHQTDPLTDPAPDSAKRRRLNIHEVLD